MAYLKFYRYLILHWKKELLVLFLSTLTIILGLVNPYLAKLVIDQAYANQDLRLFIILVLIGAVVFILQSIISGLNAYISRAIKFRINFDLNRIIFKKLQGLPYSFFQEHCSADNLYRLNHDIDQVTHFISDTLPECIGLLLKALFILIIVGSLNYKIALYVIILMPISYLAPYFFHKRIKMALKEWLEISQRVFKQLQQILTHIHLIKAFGKEGIQGRRYIKSLSEKIREGLKNTRLEVTHLFVASLINRLISGVIIFWVGLELIQGKISLGTLSAIILYIGQLQGLQNSLTQVFNRITFGLVSYDRLAIILEASPQSIEFPDAKEILFPQGGIEFKKITFGYTRDKRVFENLSFSIRENSHIALVGPSGCGKTTMTNLILRLYKLNSGQIFIDGVDLNCIRAKSLYRQIGAVLQEPYLLNDTIENNIKFAQEEADFSEIAQAARLACIDDFIHSLPEGYKTVLGEGACKISEGQKQRIAIARAIIKKPKILIFDEALSSVDAEIETKIIDNIATAFRQSTVIVISHRLSTIQRMEQVYFLASPNKVEIARHTELLRENLRYQHYLSCQVV